MENKISFLNIRTIELTDFIFYFKNIELAAM